MFYQHPSGATKRKRKREEMLTLTKLKKIDIFCKPTPKQSQSDPDELASGPSQVGCDVTSRYSAKW